MRIVVIDSEPDRIASIQQALEDTGHDLRAACSAEEALHAVQLDSTRLALIDWASPALDAPAMCQQLRETELDGGVYIIAVLPEPTAAEIAQAMNAGADDVVGDPIGAVELCSRVRIAERVLTAETRVRAALLTSQLKEETIAATQRAIQTGSHAILELIETFSQDRTAYGEWNETLRQIRRYAELLLASAPGERTPPAAQARSTPNETPPAVTRRPLAEPIADREDSTGRSKPALATDPQSAPELSGCRVLVAEDCLTNQKLAERLLQKAGAEVTLVANGRLAIDAALAATDAARPFDVILMDMQMPELDGYAATTDLRRRGYDRPIVALTAHALAHDRQKCLDAGCDDYTSKPVRRATLIEVVRKWRGRRSDVVAAFTSAVGDDEA